MTAIVQTLDAQGFANTLWTLATANRILPRVIGLLRHSLSGPSFFSGDNASRLAQSSGVSGSYPT